MRYYYLVFLLFSLSGLLYADYKHKLFFFKNAELAFRVLAIGLAFFLTWDVVGIVLDVFSTNQAWVSGIHFFTRDIPLEEFFFLSLFLFNTALVWRFVCSRTS